MIKKTEAPEEWRKRINHPYSTSLQKVKTLSKAWSDLAS